MSKEKQVGALPVRRRKNGKWEILLVTTSSGRWIVPKGCRSKRLKDHHAAAREAEEEGGVSGKIEPRALGKFTHCKRNGGLKKITVFRLDVDVERTHWREEKKRKRAWLSPKKAKVRVEHTKLRQIIDSR
jgi:8-oxo-dGTP pyrophosphatase MutT (NUDIX family)